MTAGANPFSMTKPCVDCPFRVARKFPLPRARKAEIARAVIGEGRAFPCHKTTQFDGDGAFEPDVDRNKQCAGAMILALKENRPTDIMQVGERLGWFDPAALTDRDDVYHSFAEWVEDDTDG